jgi:uncharacterized membrane protein
VPQELSKPPPLPDEAPIEEAQTAIPSPEKDRLSLEMTLGTRWLNWVGIVMLLFGIAFFMKYAYDNAWIGPLGRLALGTLFGITAVAIGERFRRKNWTILFKVLTGGGLASFYICIFFSFQIYYLSTQTISMLLAILVTGLAVTMAVAHNAMSIAILALIGGFLSPVLLSTGQNHPYALFTYIAILNLVAYRHGCDLSGLARPILRVGPDDTGAALHFPILLDVSVNSHAAQYGEADS